ncbi:hypothetical protein WDU94_005398 [Cyamophila willieti]
MIVQTKHFVKLANIKVWSEIQSGILKSKHGSFRILSNNFCKESKLPSIPKPHKTILLPEEPTQTLDNKVNTVPQVEVLEDDKNLAQDNPEVVPKKKDSLKQKLTNKLKSIVKPTENAVEETPKPEKKILEIPVEAVTKPRIRVDLSVSSTERNFITPNRAMSDFLLKQSDLEGLRIIKRRSPYENEPPISVYWRKDVEAKAIEVWGSKDRLLQERLKNELERKYQQQHIFTMKRKLREYRREQGSQADQKMAEKAGLSGSSGREDCAAVLSVLVAGSCMGLSVYTGSHIPDALGSFLVGGILGCVAFFIVTSNIEALVGRSIPDDYLDRINAELESDVMIRAIYDVKGIQMGNSLVRYKAEVDFDGRELTRSYLDQQDLNLMLEEVQSMKTIDELEAFLLKHSENIVDMVGGEIDRIEMKLRKKYPEIRHVDLEVL